MSAILNDLRLLKLAEFYEGAYEALIVDLATRCVDDPDVRALLFQLVSPDDRHHERVVEQMERLNRALTPEDAGDLMHAALLDVREVEEAARDFYTRHLDRVHDPQVAALFRRLAAEEARHMRIAEQALRLADSRTGRAPGTETDEPNALPQFLENSIPLHEGVGDLTRPRHRHKRR